MVDRAATHTHDYPFVYCTDDTRVANAPCRGDTGGERQALLRWRGMISNAGTHPQMAAWGNGEARAALEIQLLPMSLINSLYRIKATSMPCCAQRLHPPVYTSALTTARTHALPPCTAATHHCTWPGVTCDPVTERVTQITLPGGTTAPTRLMGALDGFAELAALTALNLGGNSFAGPLPGAWGALPALAQIDVSGSPLSGGLPAAWATGAGAIKVIRLHSVQTLGVRHRGLPAAAVLRLCC